MATIPKRLSITFLWLTMVMVAAALGGAITIVAFSRSLETAGVGPIAAFFVLPAILLYLLLDLWRTDSWVKHGGFIIAVAPVLAGFLGEAWYLSRHPDPDGAGEWDLSFAIAVVGAIGAVYVALGLRRYLKTRSNQDNVHA